MQRFQKKKLFMADRFKKVLVDPATNLLNTGWRGVRHATDFRGILGLRDMLQSKPRRVKKDGSLNIKFRQLEFSNPLSIDNCIYMNWLTIIWLLIIGFLICWLTFAFVYFIVEFFSGNICTIGEEEGCFRDVEDIKKSRCVTALYDFNSALQFSIETMTTVGYGDMQPTTVAGKVCQFIFLSNLPTVPLSVSEVSVPSQEFSSCPSPSPS